MFLIAQNVSGMGADNDDVVTDHREANFAWNSFCDHGTQAIARALETNNRLEVLDLSANRIAGATVMVCVLPRPM